MNTVDIPQNLRKEADRYAAMQSDKQHTNHRRKTFRFRNHLYRKAAAHIEHLQARVAELEAGYDPLWAEKRQIAIADRNAALEENKGLLRSIKKLEATIERVKDLFLEWRTNPEWFTGSKCADEVEAAIKGDSNVEVKL